MSWLVFVGVVLFAFILGHAVGGMSKRDEAEAWRLRYEHAQRLRLNYGETDGKIGEENENTSA
ncbi:MAG: hypothetical protein WC455_17745 [Dehalococcoidia bacterium]